MDIRNTAFEIYMKSLDSARVGGSADELKGLSPQETAFVKRLVMTALRRQEFIKSVIRGYAAKKSPPGRTRRMPQSSSARSKSFTFTRPTTPPSTAMSNWPRKKAANMPAASSTPYCAKSAATADK